MSAKSARAARAARAARMARMARAGVGGRVAAGFPIVDEVTLRLRLQEYGLAARRVEQGVEEVGKLRAHIVRRAFALAEKGGAGLLNALPEEWVVQELARLEAEAGRARVAERLAAIQAAGSAPYEHEMGGEE